MNRRGGLISGPIAKLIEAFLPMMFFVPDKSLVSGYRPFTSTPPYAPALLCNKGSTIRRPGVLVKQIFAWAILRICRNHHDVTSSSPISPACEDRASYRINCLLDKIPLQTELTEVKLKIPIAPVLLNILNRSPIIPSPAPAFPFTTGAAILRRGAVNKLGRPTLFHLVAVEFRDHLSGRSPAPPITLLGNKVDI
jgi:hypothetical protein